jgi:hypothetical protein
MTTDLHRARRRFQHYQAMSNRMTRERRKLMSRWQRLATLTIGEVVGMVCCRRG